MQPTVSSATARAELLFQELAPTSIEAMPAGSSTPDGRFQVNGVIRALTQNGAGRVHANAQHGRRVEVGEEDQRVACAGVARDR
jgi:hypothetical protein